MDCRTFRRLHLAFLDDTLPGADRTQMELHRDKCEECANHDARLRQTLLLARNIAPIEPSAGFQERLSQRLRSVEPDRRTVYVRSRPELYPLGSRNGGAGAFGISAMAVAACVILAVGMATYGEIVGLTPESAVKGSQRAASTAFMNGQLPDAAAGIRARGMVRSADRATSQNAAVRGYTLDMHNPSIGNPRDEIFLMLSADDDIDPAIVTSASVGLTVWPALMIPDDLPRAFREAGFSVAGMAH